MKTLVLVLLMLGVAVATAASFIVQAGAGSAEQRSGEQDAQRGRLEHRCEPAEAYAGEDTWLHCWFFAGNTGTTPLTDVMLAFQPSAGLAIPERYWFMRFTVDGAPQPVSGSNTAFQIGEIPVDTTSVVEFDVVVRGTVEAGADAVLLAAPDQRELARVTVSTPIRDGTPPAPRFELAVTSAGGEPRLELSVDNTGGPAVGGVTAEISAGEGTLPDAGVERMAENGAYRIFLGMVAADSRQGWSWAVDEPFGECPFGAAALIEFDSDASGQGAIADVDESCYDEAVTLPASGGGTAGGGEWTLRAVAFACWLAGAAALNAGMSVRRRRAVTRARR